MIDFVLAMTGYQPDFNFLRKIGLKLEKDEHKTPVCHETTHVTNIPGLYLAGVVCGGMHTNKYFIENSRDHGTKIFDHMGLTNAKK